MEEKQVDVAIIGSGSAGLYALGKVKPSGKSFVLINGGEPGTTCARVGCMPSKALIQVAEDYHRTGILGRYGVAGHKSLTLDTEETMGYVQDMRDTFVDRVLGNSTDNMSDEVFIEGYAKFVEPNLLDVEANVSAPEKSSLPPAPPPSFLHPGGGLVTALSPPTRCLNWKSYRYPSPSSASVSSAWRLVNHSPVLALK